MMKEKKIEGLLVAYNKVLNAIIEEGQE